MSFFRAMATAIARLKLHERHRREGRSAGRRGPPARTRAGLGGRGGGVPLVSLGSACSSGPIDLGIGEILSSLGGAPACPGGRLPRCRQTEETILWELRMPRVVLAALVGGMLALAGATYQGVFRNPLVDPYLLGVAAGAGLGATLAIAYLPDGLRGQEVLPPAAFLGAAAAVALAYALGRSAGRERDAATLVLAGVTVASFFTAMQTFVQQQNADTLQQVYSWILGGIPSSGWSDVVLILPYVASRPS